MIFLHIFRFVPAFAMPVPMFIF
ncbi:protein of unknown function [Shinella sp. WSC3-e]|nr:hypothetical protein SHINE37_44168 [Rhizobiaceae bacterium]CAK7258670.1 protein of unknown function [Shinella sp. WSC3-e]